MRHRFALALLAALVAFPAPGSAAPPSHCPERCHQDEACVFGRCVVACTPACREGTDCTPSGECAPRTVALGRLTEEEICLRRGKESRYSDEAVFVDFGGMLFTGLQLGYEWGKADVFVLRAKLMNLGFANYAVDSLNEYERFEFGFGASAGYRRYETKLGNLRGFYYGGGLLYHAVQSVDRGPDPFARTTHWTGLFGEFGYRWVFGSFLFGFGPSLSVRVPLVSHFAERSGGTCVEAGSCVAPTSARFEGLLSLEVGFLR